MKKIISAMVVAVLLIQAASVNLMAAALPTVPSFPGFYQDGGSGNRTTEQQISDLKDWEQVDKTVTKNGGSLGTTFDATTPVLGYIGDDAWVREGSTGMTAWTVLEVSFEDAIADLYWIAVEDEVNGNLDPPSAPIRGFKNGYRIRNKSQYPVTVELVDFQSTCLDSPVKDGINLKLTGNLSPQKFAAAGTDDYILITGTSAYSFPQQYKDQIQPGKYWTYSFGGEYSGVFDLDTTPACSMSLKFTLPLDIR